MAVFNGIILYRGPSLIDGAPIVCIATNLFKPSKNPKTGPMVQTYIMREDIAPNVAVKVGADRSICGDCMHRPTKSGSCYVKTHQAPLRVWKTYHNGGYPLATEYEMRAIKASGAKIRAGSYGDPAAVPSSVWQAVGVWTGYTHRWNEADCGGLVMASVDSVKEAAEAAKRGLRYFRVRPRGAPLISGEIDCPSSKGVSCEHCGLCSGHRVAKNISIEAHGSGAGKFERAARQLAVLA